MIENLWYYTTSHSHVSTSFIGDLTKWTLRENIRLNVLVIGFVGSPFHTMLDKVIYTITCRFSITFQTNFDWMTNNE